MTHPARTREHCLRMSRARWTRSYPERFLAKVDRRGPDECWLWTASTDPKGYGQFHLMGKPRKAPRVAFELWVGPIPDGGHILHSCDTPQCVNPAHLRVGDNEDNCRDKTIRGRQRGPRGQRNHNAKLTPAIIRKIRARRRRGEGCRALAREYGVTHGTVSSLCLGKHWSWVLDEGRANG